MKYIGLIYDFIGRCDLIIWCCDGHWKKEIQVMDNKGINMDRRVKLIIWWIYQIRRQYEDTVIIHKVRSCFGVIYCPTSVSLSTRSTIASSLAISELSQLIASLLYYLPQYHFSHTSISSTCKWTHPYSCYHWLPIDTDFPEFLASASMS